MSDRLICPASPATTRRFASHAAFTAWLAVLALAAVPGAAHASQPSPAPDPAPARSGPAPDPAPVKPTVTRARKAAPVAPLPAASERSPAPAVSATGATAPSRSVPTRRTTARSRTHRRAHATTAHPPSRVAVPVARTTAPARPNRVVAIARAARDNGALARGGLALLVLALASAALLDRVVRLRRESARG